MTHHKPDSHYRPHGSDSNRQSGASPQTSTGITEERREHMIAEAAYYLAKHRHYRNADPISDWLQAEVAIDYKIKDLRR